MNLSVPRSVLLVLCAFVVAFVACAIITGALEGPGEADDVVISSLSIGLFGAALACGLLLRPLSAEVRVLAGDDLPLTRKLKAVVFRGSDVPIDEGERTLAARFARASVTERITQLVFVTLLFAGFLLWRVWQLVDRQADGFDIAIIVFLAGVYVVAMPIYLRQFFRARAYAREHA